MERADVLQDLTPAENQAACQMCHGSVSSVQGWLAKRRGWVVVGLISVTGTGVALAEGWLTLAGIAPLLYVAPCAVMMMFCMRGMSRGMQTTPNQSSSASPPISTADSQIDS